MVEFPPAHRVQVAEQAGGILIPAPPQIARDRPQFFLRRGDEAIERARLADHRRYLRRRFGQHANFIVRKSSGLDRLHHQDALQHAAVDDGDAQEGLVGIFARLAEIFEARMTRHLPHGHRAHLFGNQAGQTLVERQTQRADTFRAQAHGGGQHQVRAVRLQQIDGANIGFGARRDQGDDVHERLSRFAAGFGEVPDFFQRQYIVGIARVGGLSHYKSLGI